MTLAELGDLMSRMVFAGARDVTFELHVVGEEAWKLSFRAFTNRQMLNVDYLLDHAVLRSSRVDSLSIAAETVGGEMLENIKRKVVDRGPTR